jgi:hypothetical protein
MGSKDFIAKRKWLGGAKAGYDRSKLGGGSVELSDNRVSVFFWSKKNTIDRIAKFQKSLRNLHYSFIVVMSHFPNTNRNFFCEQYLRNCPLTGIA